MEKKVMLPGIVLAVAALIMAACAAVTPAPVPTAAERSLATQTGPAISPEAPVTPIEEVKMVKPTTLRQGDQWPTRGGQRFFLITGPSSWAKFLRQQRSQADAWPPVDWEREVVIVALMGGKRTGGYQITITGVEVRGAEVIVRVEERVPQPGEMVIQVLTSPYHAVTVPRDALPSGAFTVRFVSPSGVWVAKVSDLGEDAIVEAGTAR